MVKFDIPINFVVSAITEEEAEDMVHKFLTRNIEKLGLEDLLAFQDFEFIATESCCSGCGDNDIQ